MKFVPWEEYQRNLPRKQMGSGVVVRNREGRVLLLKTSYRDHWQIPGGVVEKDESPRETAERETEEETGLRLKIRKLLAVSYCRAEADRDENLQWIFDGGVLTDEQAAGIKVDGEEVIDFRFARQDEVDELMKRDYSRRIPLYRKATKAGLAYYLEDWRKV